MAIQMRTIRLSIIMAIAGAATLLAAGCDDPARNLCEDATAEDFATGCEVSWTCLDGSFRLECTTVETGEESRDECDCMRDGQVVGSFTTSSLCTAAAQIESSAEPAPTEQADLAQSAASGCGWNVQNEHTADSDTGMD